MPGFKPEVKAKQPPGQTLFTCQRHADIIGKTQPMNQSKEQCQKIIDTYAFVGKFFLKQIADGGKNNGTGY